MIDTDSKTVARIFAILSAIFYAQGLFFVKRCTLTDVHTVIIFRSITNAMMSVMHGKANGVKLFVGWQSSNGLIIRGCFAIMASAGSMLATQYLTLSVFGVFTRLEMMTLMITGILFMGNKFDINVLVTILLCIFGLTLVIAPSLYGLGEKEDLSLKWNYNDFVGLGLATIWLIGDTTQIAITTKILVGGSTTVFHAVFYQSLILLIFIALLVIYNGVPVIYYWGDLFNYFGVSISMYLGTYLAAESYRVEKDLGVQTILESPYAIAFFFYDAVFFGTEISAANWFGCFLVVASALWAVYLAHRKDRVIDSHAVDQQIDV